jgi:hypothetical protein
MLKVRDSFNSKDIIELKESEEEKITGGWPEGSACSPRGKILEYNGNKYRCADRPLWFRDEWEFID